jgi:hypothetical protein
MLLEVLFDLVRFHPAGSRDVWMSMSDGIPDDLL